MGHGLLLAEKLSKGYIKICVCNFLHFVLVIFLIYVTKMDFEMFDSSRSLKNHVIEVFLRCLLNLRECFTDKMFSFLRIVVACYYAISQAETR